MRFMRSNKLAALAAISILTASTASPAIGQPIGVEAVRAGESTEGSSELGSGPWFPPLLAALIVLGGILMATGVLFDDDDPSSP